MGGHGFTDAAGPKPPSWLSDCAVLEPTECISRPECGFCFTSFSCMPGNASGPAVGALPCIPNPADPTIQPPDHTYDPASARFGWLQANCSWAYDNATYDAILARHDFGGPGGGPAGYGPLKSFDTMRYPRSPSNDSVPPEWDAPCTAGGQRRWDPLTNCNPSQKPDDPWLGPCKDNTYAWGGTRCLCPEGRVGLTCGGCASDAGCGDGFQCDLPAFSPVEEVHLGCIVPSRSSISLSPVVDPKYIFGFTGTDNAQPSFDLRLGPGTWQATLKKAIPWPLGQIVTSLSKPAPPEEGKYSRLLSGISFVAAVHSEQYVTAISHTCPDKKALGFDSPFDSGATCLRWTVSDKVKSDDLFSTSPNFCPAKGPCQLPSSSSPGGWARFDQDTKLIATYIKPPLKIDCQLPRTHDSTHTVCSLQTNYKVFGSPFIINMDCEVAAGRCNAARNFSYPSPPSAPPPPPPSPLNLLEQCALPEHSRRCTWGALLVPLGLLLVLMGSVALCHLLSHCYDRRDHGIARRRSARKPRPLGSRRHRRAADVGTSSASADAPMPVVSNPPRRAARVKWASESSIAIELPSDASSGALVPSWASPAGGNRTQLTTEFRQQTTLSDGGASLNAAEGGGGAASPAAVAEAGGRIGADEAGECGQIAQRCTTLGVLPVAAIATWLPVEPSPPKTTATVPPSSLASMLIPPNASIRQLPANTTSSSPAALTAAAAQPPPPPPPLSWHHVSYRAGRNGPRLLQPCTAELHGRGATSSGLWAMIGPSGAGKSTLLSVLAGRREEVSVEAGAGERAEVRLYGQRMGSAARRARIGFVTQEDVLPPTSTVREHLDFHARLRAPWLSRRARRQLVEASLGALGLGPLADRCIGDGFIRGLSGGERRRTSVGCELIVATARTAHEYERRVERMADRHGTSASAHMSSAPRVPLLLLDEPFSGLDSLNARLLLHALVSMVNGNGDDAADAEVGKATSIGSGQAGVGACVLLSIHQPTERFLSCMQGVVVMAPGGRLVYTGPLRLADGNCALAAAFDASRGHTPRLRDISPNPAEALLEVVSAVGDDGGAVERRLQQLYAEYAASSAASSAQSSSTRAMLSASAITDQGADAAPCLAGFGRQLLALAGRHSLVVLRDPLLVLTHLGSGLCVACVCAWAFWHVDLELSSGVLQRLGLLFFLGAHLLLTGLASMGAWRQDRLLYEHESGVGCYGAAAFVLSRTLVADAVPMRMLPTLLIACIVYPSAGLAGLAFEDSSEEVQLEFGYKKALMFVASLCLANLVLASTFACIGIVARTSEVAVLLGALYALFTLVFSGFLPTSSQMPAALSWLPYLSVLRYTFELVLSNELLGQTVMLVEEWPGSPEAGQPKPVDGATIVNSKDYLGFNPWGEGECPWGGVTLDGGVNGLRAACWFDLYVPALWFVGALGLAIGLLMLDEHRRRG